MEIKADDRIKFSAAFEKAAMGWELTEFYCRDCGRKGLLVEPGEGDYYVGPLYHCLGCSADYTMG